MSKPLVSLILPCYNEMEHIAASLSQIISYLEFTLPRQYELILIDDGSKDGTVGYLKSLPQNPAISILFNDRNLGRGGTVKKGMALAKGKVIGFMDIDCEVSETYIARFVQAILNGSDLAVGNRSYIVAHTPRGWLRHILTMGYRFLSQKLLAHSVEDSETGYKFFSQNARNVILEYSQFDNWFWDTECVLLCDAAGLSTTDLPVVFKRNIGKTSTVRPFSDSMKYLKSIRLYRMLQSQHAYDGISTFTQRRLPTGSFLSDNRFPTLEA